MNELTTNEAPKERHDLKSLLNSDAVRAQIARALPKHMTPDRFLRIATTAMLRTPKLAQCDQTSFIKACLDLSSIGLEPDGRRAHLIPFENRKLGITECQLIVDYKGLIELAKRSGDVAFWHAFTICEADRFSWRNGIVEHEVNWLKPRGQTLAVYSHVRTKDGDDDYEVMTLAEVDAIRARSRAGQSGPWVSDYDEMAKKTVMRRHSKRLTLSPEFADALDKDADRPSDMVRDVTLTVQSPRLFTAPPTTNVPAVQPEPQPEVVGASEGAPESGGDTPPSLDVDPLTEITRRLNAEGIDDAEYLAFLVKSKMAKPEQDFSDIAISKHGKILENWDAFMAAVRPKKGGSAS